MKKGMDKSGQQMTLGTIIMIVLGITVLVFLIFGFSTGWGNLWDKVTNLGGTKSNVDTIKQACALACQGIGGENSYEFRGLVRKVRIGTEEFSATCLTLSDGKNVAGGDVTVRVDPC